MEEDATLTTGNPGAKNFQVYVDEGMDVDQGIEDSVKQPQVITSESTAPDSQQKQGFAADFAL